MAGAYPTYTMSEIIKGRKLQTIDNIVSIYEIMQVSTGDRHLDHRDDIDSDATTDEFDMLDTDYRYVLKTLKRGKSEIRDDDYQRNAYLEAETRILSNMSHPNIIHLEGTSHEVDSFIILERLFDTLTYRIQQWQVEDCKIGGMVFRTKKMNKLQEKKLHVAYDITTAIEHLHKHNIVHRDIKPENFQFDNVSKTASGRDNSLFHAHPRLINDSHVDTAHCNCSWTRSSCATLLWRVIFLFGTVAAAGLVKPSE